MCEETVQFQAKEELLDYLREQGIDPSYFAREVIEATARKLRSQDTVDELADLQVELPRPVEEIIREDRDR